MPGDRPDRRPSLQGHNAALVSWLVTARSQRTRSPRGAGGKVAPFQKPQDLLRNSTCSPSAH
jgi:hypothetical protein